MKRILILTASFFALLTVKAQKALTMDEIRDAIERNHPALKMLDAEARSMDEEAKGAYSWMPSILFHRPGS